MKWDFGIRDLVPEWRLALKKDTFTKDLLAGMTIPTVAIPVSLAVALLSNVPPHWGLASAIIGAIVGTLFGGTRHMIVGPAASMALIVGMLVSKFGHEGLLVCTVGMGLLQVLTGVLELASIAKCIPFSVLRGFTSGIGCAILLRQLKPALELAHTPYEILSSAANPIEGMFNFASAIFHANPVAAAIAGTTLALCILVPKVFPKFPIPIAAVAGFSLLQIFQPLGVAVVGNISSKYVTLPLSSRSVLNTCNWGELFAGIALLYYTGSIQAVLSSAAANKIAKRPLLHDSNQEMIGQGLSNIMCGMLGSMPTTGLVAQTTLNIVSGATSRRAALIHASCLVAWVFLFSTTLRSIPVPALTGVLMYVGLRMVQFRDLEKLYRVSPPQAVVYGVTLTSMLFLGLGQGALLGSASALVAHCLSAASQKEQSFFSRFQPAQYRFETLSEADEKGQRGIAVLLSGRLSFLSALTLQSLQSNLRATLPKDKCVVEVNFERVSAVDLTAAEQLAELFAELQHEGFSLVLTALPGDTANAMKILFLS